MSLGRATGPQTAGPEQWHDFQTQILARVPAALPGLPVRVAWASFCPGATEQGLANARVVCAHGRRTLLPSTLQSSGPAPVATASGWGRVAEGRVHIPLPEWDRGKNEGRGTLSHITTSCSVPWVEGVGEQPRRRGGAGLPPAWEGSGPLCSVTSAPQGSSAGVRGARI